MLRHSSSWFAAAALALTACSSSPDTTIDSNVGTSTACLTVQGGYVYWANEVNAGPWTLQRVPVSGGAGQVLASNIANAPSSIAVDGTNIYWTLGDGPLEAAPVDGSAPPHALAPGVNARSVVLAGGQLFATAYATGFDFTIVQVPLDGSAATTVVPAAMMGTLVSDGSAVYFTTVNNCSSADPSCVPGEVFRYVPGAPAPTSVLTTTGYVSQMAASGGNVFALIQDVDPSGDGNVVRAPAAGGSSVVLATQSSPSVTHLTVVGDTASWLSTETLWSVPAAGGATTQASKDNVLNLATDGQHLFASIVVNPGLAIVQIGH